MDERGQPDSRQLPTHVAERIEEAILSRNLLLLRLRISSVGYCKQVNAAQAEPLDRRLGREIVVLLSRIVQVVKDFRFKR